MSPHRNGAGWLHLWLLRQPWTEPPGAPLQTGELDESERQRASAFLRPHDRLLYLTAHIALRRILAAYLDTVPGEVRLSRTSCPACGGLHGKPVMVGTPLHYSLSHTSGLALFGVATEPVGVDVEVLPSEETVEMCSPALHPDEQAELARYPSARRQLPFGRLWTRKEAYLKGLGTGLCRDLAADYLGRADDGPAPSAPPGWVVDNIACGSEHVNHVAAAAVVDGVSRPTNARWLPADCLYSAYSAELLGTDFRVGTKS
ncbi:4'-phosphopantetheinyl transferase family protein [Actinopolyspora mzabensis]|uniref:4'-phosphopantetheinyl transferase family protein n=1 Tax=Actinopolyspora mzabensis TaxID=995066 RepID=UPI000B814470|nr:4'-phosphopantetheinyl transferase superfamily protein [Actinopolyspora mzabensis]